MWRGIYSVRVWRCAHATPIFSGKHAPPCLPPPRTSALPTRLSHPLNSASFPNKPEVNGRVYSAADFALTSKCWGVGGAGWVGGGSTGRPWDRLPHLRTPPPTAHRSQYSQQTGSCTTAEGKQVASRSCPPTRTAREDGGPQNKPPGRFSGMGGRTAGAGPVAAGAVPEDRWART